MGEQKYSSYARLALRRWRRPARGFRLSPTRISIRRLRAKLWTLLGILGRYARNVRLLTRGLVAPGNKSALVSAGNGGGRSAAPPPPQASGNNGKAAAAAARRPPCMRSNSFYARAVAECLEFIKGSNATPPLASPLRAIGTPRRGGRC
ncbi:hypothetical protein PR202_ga17016 [Eleusine coracana subsp. coracana]|uniref:Uncharacterized protein n=1 Tax=Eleusine coracana subsp. coracana TaxID=191504 RepID=A0AAV5CN45_ELECO|nr:hypothetical protein QOZ80_6AG0519460 [Eleusine coracana subsp. coracana]GJM99877.1 hypothetical protein PR202_ga17016 [Eleusine coracana subsp. coracana]